MPQSNIETLDPSTKIVTKFLIVQQLHPGDHFYDGDSKKTARELIMSSGLTNTNSKTSLVTNLRTEVLRMTKLDFNKFASKETWFSFVENGGHSIPPIEKLSSAYIEKRQWEVYKRKIIEQVVEDYKNSKSRVITL